MSGSQRVAILTGGSGGLVPGIADQLANAGFTIVLTARGETALETAAARLRESVDTPVVAIASDARDATATKALAETVVDRFGRIDVLVNAAASSTPIGGAIEDVDIDALIADVDVKVGGYLRYAQAVVPAMKRQGAGHIVNIGGLTERHFEWSAQCRGRPFDKGTFRSARAVSHFGECRQSRHRPDASPGRVVCRNGRGTRCYRKGHRGRIRP